MDEIISIVGEVLQLGDRTAELTADTTLLGGLPEFDSMAVVTILTRVEEEYDIIIEDDEISAETFASIQSLSDFISSKL